MNLRSIDADALLLLHQESLAEWTGAVALCDLGLLQAALAYPLTAAVSGDADIADLAAAYAVGIVEHQPFVDGNKSAAFLAMGLFLRVNGWTLNASEADATSAMMDLASGQIDKTALADWLRSRL